MKIGGKRKDNIMEELRVQLSKAIESLNVKKVQKKVDEFTDGLDKLWGEVAAKLETHASEDQKRKDKILREVRAKAKELSIEQKEYFEFHFEAIKMFSSGVYTMINERLDEIERRQAGEIDRLITAMEGQDKQRINLFEGVHDTLVQAIDELRDSDRLAADRIAHQVIDAVKQDMRETKADIGARVTAAAERNAALAIRRAERGER
jgi:tetrahydromethanopterin S-methyltransferase subunit G